jgi:thiol-disulfide isomerase/thioredoxin
VAAALVVAAAAVLFGRPLQRELIAGRVVRSPSTTEAVIQELITGARQPARMIERLWQTRFVPHRRFVINHVNGLVPADRELFQQVRPLVLQAAHDADEDVREIALGILARARDPELPRLARELLTDVDPVARTQGLRQLEHVGDRTLVPVVIPLLDDPDARVVASAGNLLRKWTGQDYGPRLAHVIRRIKDDRYQELSAEQLQQIRDGVARWKSWWQAHQHDFPPAPPLTPVANPPVSLRAADFALPDLEARPVRLSDFRGRVVLLNFWATWCTSCLLELPDLIELQRRNPQRLVVLGIALDGPHHRHEHPEGEIAGLPRSMDYDLEEIRQQVRRFAQQHAINYRVLLDPGDTVGVRFLGEELPTTVLIDPQGQVRRRLVGGRSASTFEAMIRALAEP